MELNLKTSSESDQYLYKAFNRLAEVEGSDLRDKDYIKKSFTDYLKSMVVTEMTRSAKEEVESEKKAALLEAEAAAAVVADQVIIEDTEETS